MHNPPEILYWIMIAIVYAPWVLAVVGVIGGAVWLWRRRQLMPCDMAATPCGYVLHPMESAHDCLQITPKLTPDVCHNQ